MSETTLSVEEKAKLLEGLEKLTDFAQQVTPLLKLLVYSKYDKALAKVLPSKAERAAYEHSDGGRSSRQVAEVAGVSHTTVNTWWKEWTDRGMGERLRAQGPGKRFVAKYALLELSVAVMEGQVESD